MKLKIEPRCKICGYLAENNQGLSSHIRMHGYTVKTYFDEFLKQPNEEYCKCCGKPTKFLSLYKRYRTYCSAHCNIRYNSIKEKENTFKKYSNYLKKLNYELITYSYQVEIKCNKCNNIFKISKSELHNRIKSHEEICMICNPKPAQKDVYQKNKQKMYQAQIKKYNGLYVNTKECKEKRHKIAFNKFKEKYENKNYVILDRIKDCNGYEIIKCKCNLCNKIFYIKNKLLKYRIKNNLTICTICNKKQNNAYKEKEVSNFIKDHYNESIIENSRKIISNDKEIDIYLPDLNFAIEFDGLYWHNVAHKGKEYQLFKTNECDKRNIKLIHIYEDEWYNKKDIIKSLILKYLGLNKKIYQYNCKISDSNENINEFFKENSLEKTTIYKTLSFMQNEDIISAITYKEYENKIIIINYAEKIGIDFIDGLNNYIEPLKKMNKKQIIYYADRRFYRLNEFNYINYDYIPPLPEYFYFRNREEYEVNKDKINNLDYNTIYNSGYYKLYF